MIILLINKRTYEFSMMSDYIHISCDSFLSPIYNDYDGIFYNGQLYSSVMDFILMNPSYTRDTITDLVLCKFTQHLHYQKQLMDTCNKQLRFQNVVDESMHEDIMHAYQAVYATLKQPSDVELNEVLDKHGLMSMPHGDKRNKTLQFFRSALPFKGRNQALFLTLVYANKLIHGCIYDRRVEKVLMSLTCDAVP